MPLSDIQDILPFGNFSELDLPASGPGVFPILCSEDVANLLEDQFIEASKLFEKYSHIFAKDDFDLGCATNVQHVLDIGDHPPIRSRPHRRSQAEESIIMEELNKLLDSGMIIPSNSPWASPILIVKKKDGSNHVVIDYCKLNLITKKDSYPLPQIDNTLDCLGHNKYFSSMDLISVYWQFELPESEQEKCAIITSSGLYQPTRMPQGLCNAPATFQ